MAAFAVAETGLLAKDLSSHLLHVHAMGKRLVVWPVGRGDRVGGSQVGAHTDRDGLLPGGEVHLAGNRARGDIEGGRLALHVDLNEGLLEDADPHHLSVHAAQSLVVGHHGPPWVV